MMQPIRASCVYSTVSKPRKSVSRRLNVSAFRSENQPKVSVDVFKLLQTNKGSSKDTVRRSFERLVKRPPAVGYSQDTLFSRAVLLRTALNNVTNIMGAKAAPSPTVVEVDMSDIAGALCLLQECGDANIVLQLGNKFIQEHPKDAAAGDVAMAVAFACCDVAVYLLEQSAASLTLCCDHLRTAMSLLQGYNMSTVLQQQIAAVVKELTADDQTSADANLQKLKDLQLFIKIGLAEANQQGFREPLKTSEGPSTSQAHLVTEKLKLAEHELGSVAAFKEHVAAIVAQAAERTRLLEAQVLDREELAEQATRELLREQASDLTMRQQMIELTQELASTKKHVQERQSVVETLAADVASLLMEVEQKDTYMAELKRSLEEANKETASLVSVLEAVIGDLEAAKQFGAERCVQLLETGEAAPIVFEVEQELAAARATASAAVQRAQDLEGTVLALQEELNRNRDLLSRNTNSAIATSTLRSRAEQEVYMAEALMERLQASEAREWAARCENMELRKQMWQLQDELNAERQLSTDHHQQLTTLPSWVAARARYQSCDDRV